MPKIEVQAVEEALFHVRVVEGQTESRHQVKLDAEYYQRLAGGPAGAPARVSPQELVRRSFEFLLQREPKESILPKFDLRIIARYFPDYEREIKRVL